MDDTRRRKIKYRAAHRGFREADLILGPFATTHVDSLSPADLDDFETLLDEPDHDIYNWIVGRFPTPDPFATPVMARLREFRFEVHAVRGDDVGA
jgi:antitoxin CptB